MPKPGSSAVTLAIIGQKLDHLAEHMQKIERRMDERDGNYQFMAKEQALIHQEIHGDSGIKDQIEKQWARHDWSYRAIWSLIVSNSAILLFLLGSKALVILKVMSP